MATNNFKPFAIGSGANVTSQSDYEQLVALLTGFQAGKASSAQINKALRQSSVMAHVLAQFISDSAGVDVLDNGNPANILANLKAGMVSLTPGRLINVQTFPASGTYTRTPGAKWGIAEGVGGGAAGGGATAGSSTSNSCGGGGGAGAYGMALIQNLPATAPVIIGAAGIAATGAAGSDGGQTSFGTFLTLPGGKGGGTNTASNSALISGGGLASGTPIISGATDLSSYAGQSGTTGIMLNGQGGLGGNGGNSPFGSGPRGSSLGSGSSASGRGAGGGGALNLASSAAAVAGGFGSLGFIRLFEYA